jgi:hypothetical protein
MTSSERGAAFLLTFLAMLVLVGLALAVGVFAHNSVVTSRTQFLDRQAMYLAEAGWQRGRQAFAADLAGWGASSSNTESFGAGQYTVAISSASPYTLTATGYVGTTSNYTARREIVESGVTRTAAGSSNSAGSATADASSEQSASFAAENANDGSTSTTWRAGTQGSGEWLAMEFGSSTTLNRIIVREEQFIAGVSIQSCASGGTGCSTVSGLSCSESGTTWTCDFSSTSAVRYHAVFTATASNRRVEVQEMETYNTAATGYTLSDGTFSTQY